MIRSLLSGYVAFSFTFSFFTLCGAMSETLKCPPPNKTLMPFWIHVWLFMRSSLAINFYCIHRDHWGPLWRIPPILLVAFGWVNPERSHDFPMTWSQIIGYDEIGMGFDLLLVPLYLDILHSPTRHTVRKMWPKRLALLYLPVSSN